MTSAGRLLATPLPPPVQLVEPEDGLPHLAVAGRAAAAQVFFHGAHIARWAPARVSQPVLWLSTCSLYRGDKGIRGGVPICYPWFGAHASDGTAPAHGFARLVDWTLTDAAESADGEVLLTFVLETTEDLSPLWPHRSRATYRLAIGATLAMALDIENRGREPVAFEEAFHTYLSVDDIAAVSIAGLEGTHYLDKVDAFARKRQGSDPIRFSGETDRVYVDTDAPCRITDPGWSRTIVVSKAGSRSTVVWNPGADRARAFSDIGEGEWRRMVCVETANVGDAAIQLAPGETHTMQAVVSIAERAS